MSTIESKPVPNSTEQKNDNHDGRKISSPENGRIGGRKVIANLTDVAREFNRHRKCRDGAGWRYYRGSWYKYDSGRYVEIPDTDFKAKLIKFIQDNYRSDIERISGAIIHDVILNLKSDNICFLPSDKQEPFFISGMYEMDNIFNMKNGLVNRNTLEIKPHTPNLFSTLQLPYEYRENEKCPHWLQYLGEVQQDSPENIESLQLMFGLCLVPETRFNVAFYLYGEGGTGKSVCLHILTKLIGEHNVCVVPLHRLSERFSLYPLTNKLLNVVGESPHQTKYGELTAAENRLKEITDGALIDVERKMQDGYKARAIARCVFATNNLPLFSDRSNGLWDRLRIIPFKTRIRGTKMENNNLRFELESELPGIFLWALDGLRKLEKLQRFPDTSEGINIREEQRSVCDHERTFLTENYAFEIRCLSETKIVYERYRDWMENNGYQGLGDARFSQAVKRIFPKVYKDRNSLDGKVYWMNLVRL